jgi:hydrogenase maturation protein HypF
MEASVEWHSACHNRRIRMRFFHFPLARISAASNDEGRRIEVRGTVQGVGYRPWVYRTAREAHVTGTVRNHTGGVTIEAFGAGSAIDTFIQKLSVSSPPAAVIDTITAAAIPFQPHVGFTIVDSERRAETRLAIPPDLATCAQCAAEMNDPRDRRYQYAFTNCTNCGPRFTIATSAPYDRPQTTMAPFRMCAACQREYDDPDNRRFHAQPNACRVCGPRLTLAGPEGANAAADPLAAAAKALCGGRIVAVKGIGGFHLACDATSAEAVARLRARKHRDEKPFAVMVKDIEQARELAELSPAEERLLGTVERPIVLATRRSESILAEAVAPANPLVGLLLPYSPLHHLLLERVGRPLVMTSANLAEEPIAYRNDEALRRLAGIADLFLLHDRDIVTRCDDSIARIIDGHPAVLRRSRGYVPRPIALAHESSRRVLGCGALLKSTFALVRGTEACLGPHIGDLENLDTLAAYRESIARFEQFLQFEPEIVAHDLHPDYLSTQYAHGREGVTTIGVQHHHAHVASLMAEHGLQGPVIGVAFDGTGMGTDGESWGGEFMIAEYTRFRRIATFRPIALPGGDTATRQPWRTALALLDDAFGGDAPLDVLPLFQSIPSHDLDVVQQMIHARFNSPLAHGVGRYFDAMGAIGLSRPRATYEGQIALAWNLVADPHERRRYAYHVTMDESPWQVDLRPAIRDAVFQLVGGESPARVSARFHNTLAAATGDVVRAIGHNFGRMPIALSGGCFQNARLTESIVSDLAPCCKAYTHAKVPTGDGGISLGQAVVADAIARRM